MIYLGYQYFFDLFMNRLFELNHLPCHPESDFFPFFEIRYPKALRAWKTREHDWLLFLLFIQDRVYDPVEIFFVLSAHDVEVPLFAYFFRNQVGFILLLVVVHLCIIILGF